MSDHDELTPLLARPELLLSRRSAVVGVAATTVLGAGTMGCKPCFSPVQPKPPTTQKPGPRTITVRLTIREGKFRELRALLDGDLDPFEVPAAGIHYARLFTTDQRSLFFMVIYDRYEQSIRMLSDNAAGVDPIFELCEGYPPGGAADTPALNRWIWDNKICVELYYRAYNESQPVIRDALTLRENFLSFLQRSQGKTGAELRALYEPFWNDPHLVVMLPKLALQRQGQNAADLDVTSKTLLRMEPIVGEGRVNPFTLLARVKPGQLRKIQRTLRLGTWATIDLGLRPLSDLPTLHFARVSIINGDQMLFASVYDGDFIQYVEDFGTRIAKEIDQVFGVCIGYPLAGSQDVAQFKDFLRSHELQTNAFGGSYLNHTLLEIQSSLALADELECFRKRVDPDDPKLRKKLDRFLYKNQLLLT